MTNRSGERIEPRILHARADAIRVDRTHLDGCAVNCDAAMFSGAGPLGVSPLVTMLSRPAPKQIFERNFERARYLNNRREAGIGRPTPFDHRDQRRGEPRPAGQFASTQPLGDSQPTNSTAEPDHAQMIRRAQKFMQELSSTIALVRGEIRLSEQVRKLRTAKNLTQVELGEKIAAKLHDAGIKKKMHRNTIGNIEMEKGETSFMVVAALADFFQVSLDELVFGISEASMTREVLAKISDVQRQQEEIKRHLERPEKSTVRPSSSLNLPPKRG